MRLNELYTAFQGEGPRLGTESVFIRLHHCPVKCAWCDTAFTWDGSEEGTAATPDEVAAKALDLVGTSGIRNFVITGGEPAINKDLGALVYALLGRSHAHTVEIETSGAVPPPGSLFPPSDSAGRLRVNVSPKLPSAKPLLSPDPDVLRKWIELYDCHFKFVLGSEDDWVAMVELLKKLPALFRETVWLMPEGRTRDEIARSQAWLLTRAAGSGYQVTTRMHVLAYDVKRGV